MLPSSLKSPLAIERGESPATMADWPWSPPEGDDEKLS